MATTVEHARGARDAGSLRESNHYRIFVAAVCLIALTTLFLCAIPTSSGFSAVRSNGWDVLVWTLLVGCTSCLPIYSGRGAWLSLDLPLLLAAGFVFGPAIAGAIGLLGAWDMREIRRDISPTRAIFNRSQVALSAMAGALVFEAVGGRIGAWPGAGLAATPRTTCRLCGELLPRCNVDLHYSPQAVHVRSQRDATWPSKVIRALLLGAWPSGRVDCRSIRIIGNRGCSCIDRASSARATSVPIQPHASRRERPPPSARQGTQ